MTQINGTIELKLATQVTTLKRAKEVQFGMICGKIVNVPRARSGTLPATRACPRNRPGIRALKTVSPATLTISASSARIRLSTTQQTTHATARPTTLSPTRTNASQLRSVDLASTAALTTSARTVHSGALPARMERVSALRVELKCN